MVALLEKVLAKSNVLKLMVFLLINKLVFFNMFCFKKKELPGKLGELSQELDDCKSFYFLKSYEKPPMLIEDDIIKLLKKKKNRKRLSMVTYTNSFFGEDKDLVTCILSGLRDKDIDELYDKLQKCVDKPSYSFKKTKQTNNHIVYSLNLSAPKVDQLQNQFVKIFNKHLIVEV